MRRVHVVTGEIQKLVVEKQSVEQELEARRQELGRVGVVSDNKRKEQEMHKTEVSTLKEQKIAIEVDLKAKKEVLDGRE